MGSEFRKFQKRCTTLLCRRMISGAHCFSEQKNSKLSSIHLLIWAVQSRLVVTKYFSFWAPSLCHSNRHYEVIIFPLGNEIWFT